MGKRGRGLRHWPSDRLVNFHTGSEITGLTPMQTLWGYLAKHLASVRDIVNGKVVSREVLREKIGDSRNYLVLLEALALDGGTPSESMNADEIQKKYNAILSREREYIRTSPTVK
jgi:hypothetical protein